MKGRRLTSTGFFRAELLAVAVAVAVLAVPASAKPIQDKATSSVEIDFPNGVLRVQTRTGRFTVASYWPEGARDPVHVLLQERVDIARRADAEGPQSATVALVAWRVEQTRIRPRFSTSRPRARRCASRAWPAATLMSRSRNSAVAALSRRPSSSASRTARR